MALEKHVVELTAKDSLSRALQNVGKEAQAAGLKGEQGAQKAARASADWGKAASALGLGLGALGAIAIKLGNESEVVNQRLQQSVENAGDSYDELKDKIDAAAESALSLGFDDEDALAALAKLTDATGDTAEAIDALALAEDIARARGISLGAAADIVTKASLGQYGALKRVGIVIDENATKEEALAAIQAKFAGQADAYADTNAAAWDRVGNTIENKLESIGGALADFQLPLLAIGAGAQTIGPLGDAFTALSGKAKLASLAVTAGPWAGLALGVGLAAGAIYYLTTRETEAEKQVKALNEATAAYTQTIIDQTTALAQLGLLDEAQSMKKYLDVINSDGAIAQERIDLLSTAIGNLATISAQGGGEGLLSKAFQKDGEFFDQHVDDLLRIQGAYEDNIVTTLELEAVQAELRKGFDLTTTQATALDNAMIGVTNAMADPSLLGSEMGAKASEILTNMYNGVLDVDRAITLLIELPTDQYFNKAARASTSFSDATKDATKAAIDLAKANSRAGWDKMTAGALAYQEQVDAAAEASKRLSADLETLATSLEFDAAGAASAAYDRVVGFTSGITASIQTTKDWADALFLPIDGLTIMSDLLARGIIDAEDVTEATTAQVQITDALAESTDAMNEIQIKQASTLADGAMASADYLQNIAKLDEAEQALALAWADTDIAGRANDIAGMAAEFGNMNTAQQLAFENMVLSAAATDPELARVLESLGLIIEDVNDPTGYKLNVDSSSSQTGLNDLAGGIHDLIEVLGVAFSLDVDAILHDSAFWEGYANLPNIKYIDIYTIWHGGGAALGGMVPYPDTDTAALGRVSGGNMTLVGEHGPELVKLNGGDMVIPNHASRYMDQGKSGGGITFNGPITIVANNPEQFMQQMRSYSTTMERR